MRTLARTIAVLACGGLLVAACGAGATPTAPSGTPPPASPTPAVAPPTTAPTATTIPMTDGQGPEHFSYVSGSAPYLEVQYTQTTVGDVVQYRGGVSAWDFTTTDPRMGGHARFPFSVDAYGTVGPEWGTLEIKNANGAWTGSCTGASSASGDQTLLGCWLVGSGGYAGYSAYYSLSDLGPGSAGMDGVIFPGSPPKP